MPWRQRRNEASRFKASGFCWAWRMGKNSFRRKAASGILDLPGFNQCLSRFRKWGGLKAGDDFRAMSRHFFLGLCYVSLVHLQQTQWTLSVPRSQGIQHLPKRRQDGRSRCEAGTSIVLLCICLKKDSKVQLIRKVKFLKDFGLSIL